MSARRCTPDDVVKAYQAVLGRAPESEAVIEHNLSRTPHELAAVLLRSTEFRTKLLEIAAGKLSSHATMPPDAVAACAAWAQSEELLAGDPAAAAASSACLLAGLLASPAIAPGLSGLDPDLSDALKTFGSRPDCTALHLLTRPAGPADGRLLAWLLTGPEAAAAPAEAAPDVPLHVLLREFFAQHGLQQALIVPLIRGGELGVFRLDAAQAEAVAEWLQRRLGTPVLPRGDALHLGALLGGFLRLPAVAELFGRLWPAEHDAMQGALSGVESGAHRLLALRASAADVAGAYLAVLGRAAEAAVLRENEGSSLHQIVGTLLQSNEFRAHVLARLAVEGVAIPHLGLTLSQRRLVDEWLAGRAGVVARPSAAAPLHPMALLARLLSLPVLEAELRRAHGPLWTDARSALAAWVEASASGDAIGAIDYVTGDWIVGWATQRDAGAEPQAVEVELLCNGGLVGLGRADRPRPGVGEGTGADQAAAAIGFRIPWQGRARLAAGNPQGFRFEIVDRRSGTRIGPPFQLDSVFTEPRSTLQTLTAELRQARATLQRLEALLPQLESFTGFPPHDHAAFRRQHRPLPPPVPAAQAAVHVLVAAAGVPVRGLRRTLDSLERQGSDGWTADVLTDASDHVALVDALAARDRRIRLAPAGASEAEAEREAAQAAIAAGASLVLLVPPGILLADCALAWFAHAAARHPGSPAFYADEDVVTEELRDRDRHDLPVFRTALDHWELPRRNPCGEVLCARPAALLAALGAAAHEPDRTARRWITWAALAQAGPVAHIPRLLASMQAEAAADTAAAPAPTTVALRPLLRHPWLLPDTPAPADIAARLTVIVPTRNGGALVRDCLDALVNTAARPDQLDVLVVDNGSDEPATLDLLAGLARSGAARVLPIPEPFNWSRLNNLAAREAMGEHLLFLNDDTRMLTRGWDRRLRRLLAEPEVGAVGARMAYEDLTLQHAGVVMGVEGLGAHEGVGAPFDEGGPLGRWQSLRCVAAVTGAFLACRREVFGRIGPFDEGALPITFNDVDFCLRLRAAGLRVLYAPEIALVHYESKSRGLDDLDARKQERAAFERRKLIERWGGAVLLDPGFNPHWSRWTRPFAAIREPSPAEIEAHLAASAEADPWNPLPWTRPTE